MTCEQKRCSAYSEDLRWRVVWQRHALGNSTTAIAKNLAIHRSTVIRTLELFQNTGSVTKKPYPAKAAFRKVTTVCGLYILRLVTERPRIYLHEIKRKLEEMLMVDVSLSTIFRFLNANKFTRQKMRNVAPQRDAFAREYYVSEVSLYSTDIFVFVDETGADHRNTLRKHGYSIRGIPPVNHSLHIRGERVSVIACMSVEGILYVKTLKGTSDDDIFYDFVQCYLLPHLMPFDGKNPHSVVVLDNCSIHHITEVTSILQEVGVLVHYLPPYSPDFNPIEEAFSKVKSVLMSQDNHSLDVEVLLLNVTGFVQTYHLHT